MKWARNAILNLPGHHSVAAISAEIEWHDDKEDKDNSTCKNLDGNIYISDCSRVICIDIQAWLDRENIEQSLNELNNNEHKIKQLISVLTELQAQYKTYKKEAEKWLKQ